MYSLKEQPVLSPPGSISPAPKAVSGQCWAHIPPPRSAWGGKCRLKTSFGDKEMGEDHFEAHPHTHSLLLSNPKPEAKASQWFPVSLNWNKKLHCMKRSVVYSYNTDESIITAGKQYSTRIHKTDGRSLVDFTFHRWPRADTKTLMFVRWATAGGGLGAKPTLELQKLCYTCSQQKIQPVPCLFPAHSSLLLLLINTNSLHSTLMVSYPWETNIWWFSCIQISLPLRRMR